MKSSLKESWCPPNLKASCLIRLFCKYRQQMLLWGSSWGLSPCLFVCSFLSSQRKLLQGPVWFLSAVWAGILILEKGWVFCVCVLEERCEFCVCELCVHEYVQVWRNAEILRKVWNSPDSPKPSPQHLFSSFPQAQAQRKSCIAIASKPSSNFLANERRIDKSWH